MTDTRPPGAKSARPPNGNALRLLVADDHAANRKLAALVLERLGHHADFAENGRQALELLRRGAYDLVLMDVRMPVLDGLEACRQWRAEEPDGSRLPIVAMTAHDTQEDRQRCRDAGMDDFVAKPIRAALLGAFLQKLARTGQGSEKPSLATSAAAVAAPVAGGALYDEPALLDEVGGDLTHLRQVLGLFIGDLERAVERLEQGRRGDDHVALGATAHLLKGAAGNVFATPLRRLAEQVQDLAERSDPGLDSQLCALIRCARATAKAMRASAAMER